MSEKVIDFSKPYICGRHGILDHEICVWTKTPAQMMRRVLTIRRAKKWLLQHRGFRCNWCGRFGSKARLPLSVDHVIPIAKGGNNLSTNLAWACEPCQQLKGNHLPDDPAWLAILGVIKERGESDSVWRYVVEKRRKEKASP